MVELATAVADRCSALSAHCERDSLVDEPLPENDESSLSLAAGTKAPTTSNLMVGMSLNVTAVAIFFFFLLNQ